MKYLIEMKKIAILLMLFVNYLVACHLCFGNDQNGSMCEHVQNNSPPFVLNFDSGLNSKTMVENWLKGLPKHYDAIPEVLIEDTI